MKLNVLIACEESQAETMAFRELGHRAFSCDIKPARKNTPKEWHITGDVSPYLDGVVQFITDDGRKHKIKKWHLIIAHPPCTYLCKLSSVRLIKNGIIDRERLTKMEQAREFFLKCLKAKAQYVAVENPLPMARARLPQPSCYIQPSWFGVKYTKKTLFWLKGLPPIMPQIEHPKPKSFVYASRGIYRSRTFPQVAKAIAKQWSEYITGDIKLRKKWKNTYQENLKQ